MKKLFTPVVLFALTLALGACSRSVSRINPSNMPDINGTWNTTDSRLTADEMIGNVMSAPWLTNHNGKPTVIVGMVINKSHEHLEAETFMKDLERSFINTNKIKLVQSGVKREEMRSEKADQQSNASTNTMKKFGLEHGADYILQGSINSIVDAFKRNKTVTYQVNLELTNIETNEVVWIGDKKIAKYVKN